MTELWPKYTQEEPLSTGIDYASHADTEDLAFLNYDVIPQEQIADMNNVDSFVSGDVSTPSDSSEEETQKCRLIVSQLDLEVKALKKTYVGHENNAKDRLAKIKSSLENKVNECPDD